MADGVYRIASTFFVTLSFLLQILSIASPGWIVDIYQNTDVYHSIFYKLTCKTQIKMDCEVKTYYKLYKDRQAVLDKSNAYRMAYIIQDKDMYEDVQDMIFLMVALLCTFAILVAQIARNCNSEKRYLRVTTVSPIVLTFAAGLMISVICGKVIENYHLSEIRDLDDIVDHTYVGFPYSLTMYIAALLFNLLTALLQTCQVTGSQKKPLKKKLTEDYDVPVVKRPPVSQTTAIKDNEISVVNDNVYDNPTFSIKL